MPLALPLLPIFLPHVVPKDRVVRVVHAEAMTAASCLCRCVGVPGGAAPSAAMMAHFRSAVGDSVRQMSIFKATLKAVAVLRKPPGGAVPVWRLRSTYEAD